MEFPMSSTEIAQLVIIKPLFSLPVEALKAFQQFVAVVHF